MGHMAAYPVWLAAGCCVALAYFALVLRDLLRKRGSRCCQLSAIGFLEGFRALRSEICAWLRPLDTDDVLSERVDKEVQQRLEKNMAGSVSTACAAGVSSLVVVWLVDLAGYHRNASAAQNWMLLTGIAACIVGRVRPNLMRGRCLLFWYSLAMLFFSCMLAFHTTTSIDWLVIVSLTLMPFRLMFSVTYPKLLAVIFWSCAYLASAGVAYRSIRVSTAGDLQVQQWVVAETVSFFAVVCCAAQSGASMVAEVRHMVQATTARDERAAMERLLSLLCDVVVGLDGSLRIAQEAPKIAGLLCLNPRNSLRGVPFRDFMPLAEDRRQFEDLLLAAAEDTTGSLPGVMHATLRDSDGTQFSVEVFYVPFRGLDGCSQFLIGLQEESCQRPVPELRQFPDPAGAGAASGAGPAQPQPRPQAYGRAAPRGTPAQPAMCSLDGDDGDSQSEGHGRHCCGSSVPSQGKRLLVPHFRRTAKCAQDLSIVAAVLRWNVAIAETACCPFHASVLEVKRCLQRLDQRRCKPNFKPSWDAQCQDCGMFAEWQGRPLGEGAAAREACTACRRLSVARGRLSVAL